MSTRKTIGLIITIFAGCGLICAAIIFIDDLSGWIYNYRGRLSSHELAVLLTGFMSAVFMVVGVAMLVSNEDPEQGVKRVWFCDNCRASNDCSYQYCSRCGTGRNQGIPKEEYKFDPNYSWYCKKCGSANKLGTYKCTQCGSGKS